MRAFKFIFTAVIAVLLVILSAANGGDITVKLWPDMSDYGLPSSPVIETQIFIVALVWLIVGFFLGMIREWLRETKIRFQGSRSRREAEALRKKVEQLTASDDDIPAISR